MDKKLIKFVKLNGDKVDENFITNENCEETVKMIMKFAFENRKELVKWFRLLIVLKAQEKNVVRVFLCSEFEHVMFPVFMDLLVKLIVYHKEEGLKIESCQLRSGNVYMIKVMKNVIYNSRRILKINSKEVSLLINVDISSNDIWRKFFPIFELTVRPREKLINGVFESRSVLIISSNYDARMNWGSERRSVFIGENRFEKKEGWLKGGLNTIHLKIYGSVIDLNVEENTRATMIYNLAAAWMGVDPSSISVEICKIGKYVEGMGDILTKDDLIWNGCYNFEWSKVKLTQKKMNIENYKFDPEENIDVEIDLKTIRFKARINRFLKIATVEKIIEVRFMKEYGICPVFNNFSDTMYCRDMKLEMFEGEL
jgi:hypothetical protein